MYYYLSVHIKTFWRRLRERKILTELPAQLQSRPENTLTTDSVDVQKPRASLTPQRVVSSNPTR